MKWEDVKKELFTPQEIEKLDRLVELEVNVIRSKKGRKRLIHKWTNRMIEHE